MKTRKEQAVNLAGMKLKILITKADLEKLYEIVVNEAENWDGEEVDPEQIADTMVGRYKTVGLIPSRN